MLIRTMWELYTDESIDAGGVEDYGVVMPDGSFVSMRDVVGDAALNVLHKATVVVEVDDVSSALDWYVFDQLESVDHVQPDGLLAWIVYGSGRPVDEPFVSSVWLQVGADLCHEVERILGV